MPKLKTVRGWTLLRGEADWHQWHKEGGALHARSAPCFPCFVQERLANDEETTYEYLTLGMMGDMMVAAAPGLASAGPGILFDDLPAEATPGHGDS